jgi:creatinine amidohydrolase
VTLGPTAYPLCVTDDATFWPWQAWPAFEAWPDKAGTVVVVPIAGFMAMDEYAPLDAEEARLTDLVAGASREIGSPKWLLTLSPLRFVAGPDPRCAFAVSPPVAHALIAEVVGSVAAAGFRKILLFNSSPWNEEICVAAARDLHVEMDLDMFCLQMSALGEDASAKRVGSLLRELFDWRRLLPGSAPPATAQAPDGIKG